MLRIHTWVGRHNVWLSALKEKELVGIVASVPLNAVWGRKLRCCYSLPPSFYRWENSDTEVNSSKFSQELQNLDENYSMNGFNKDRGFLKATAQSAVGNIK